MKRNMDLIRKILLETENHKTSTLENGLQIKGYSPEEVDYHIELLGEARLIEVTGQYADNKTEWMSAKLTWEGHDFLDVVRKETN